MLALEEYQDVNGRSPFARWFRRLDPVAAAKVTVVLARLEAENTASLKGVGTKKRQDKDIADAIGRWLDYRARKNAVVPASARSAVRKRS